MAKKEFTLTGKGTLNGKGYSYTKGDVISEDELSKLPRKHQGYFEEGRIDLNQASASPAAQADKKEYEDLQKRVEALEQRVAGLESIQSGGSGKSGGNKSNQTKQPEQAKQ